MRHLLDVDDLTPDELRAILSIAAVPSQPVLSGAGVALLFEKPSLRTRSSTEMAVVALGGHPVSMRADEVGLGTREDPEDVVQTLACYHAAVAARVFEHAKLDAMAAVGVVPVVNLLSDDAHPLQAIADVMTITDELGAPDGLSVAYVGDGNNVCRSLAMAAGMLGMDVRVATPRGFELPAAAVERLAVAGVEIVASNDPREAVRGADVVYTDVWASMGQESEAEDRRERFSGFMVDEDLMTAAAPGAIFLHCLPAHRGEEVSGPVIDGPASRVWAQARNRMHAARAVLAWLVEQR